MLPNALRALYQNMEFFHPTTAGPLPPAVKQALILGPASAIFCGDGAGGGDDNDLFVPEYDQRGGLDPAAVTVVDLAEGDVTTAHFGVINAQVETRLVELLNSPVSDPVFAESIPSPAGVPRQTSCAVGGFAPLRAPAPAPASLATGSLEFASPTPGTPVTPGQTVQVTLQAVGGYQADFTVVVAGGSALFLEEGALSGTIAIPEDALGAVEVAAMGIDATGELVFPDAVTLPVQSQASLVSMEVLNGDVILVGPGAKRSLTVFGYFDDGVRRVLSGSAQGTVYSTSNGGVASISSKGTVTATGPGIATLTARNGDVFTSVSVTVGNDTDGDGLGDDVDPCVNDPANACLLWADICPESDPKGVEVTLYPVLPGVPADDEGVSAEMFLGFNPFVFGSSARRFRVFSNGFSMHRYINPSNLGDTGTPFPLPHADALEGMLAPLWTDLEGVRVCMRESADRLTLQWTGEAVATGVPVEFQATIEGSTGSIKYVYGPNHDPSASELACIGLEGGWSAHGFDVAYLAQDAALPVTGYELTPDHPQWSTSYTVDSL